MIEWSKCEDQKRIETEIINYYKQLCSKNTRTAAWFSTWVGKNISQEQAAWLERKFEEEEIKVALFCLAADILLWRFPENVGNNKVWFERSISKFA